MKQRTKQFLSLILAISSLITNNVFGDDVYAPVEVYDHIKDICHPTLDDYWRIQQYLTYGERSIIKRLDDYQPNARNFKLIGTEPDELPQSGMIAVNCSENDRENCLIVYSSFNKNYPRGLKRLVKLVSESDFKGHILYRLGGWPNTEEGSLTLAHVPYAFKVCFFKEAKRLGYKRAFWLDTSIVPIVSLNKIFDMIKEKGYFIMGNSHMIGPYMHPGATDAFGIKHEITYQIPSCSAGITGIDFTNKIGSEIIANRQGIFVELIVAISFYPFESRVMLNIMVGEAASIYCFTVNSSHSKIQCFFISK